MVRVEALLADARRDTEARLAALARRAEDWRPGIEAEAIAYALATPGKRVRAALVRAAYEAGGGRSAAVGGVMAAVEVVHAYSLVHDDLPSMDDDDLRRGRATLHRAFDVSVATRTGWLLVPVAALALSEAAGDLDLEPGIASELARILFTAGGIGGMVGGQWLDLEAEGRPASLEALRRIHRAKTGALIEAACVIGGLAARAPESTVAALRTFGADVGLAFQVADDVLDATGTSGQLGKTAGRDATLAKSTYVALLGIDGARAEAWRLAAAARDSLRAAGMDGGALADLAGYIASRSA
ncbi:MAG: polyprenyl synthetase family protein [Gemmatimonadales bacterium]